MSLHVIAGAGPARPAAALARWGRQARAAARKE